MNSDFSDFIRFFPIFRLFPTFRLLDSTTLFSTQLPIFYTKWSIKVSSAVHNRHGRINKCLYFLSNFVWSIFQFVLISMVINLTEYCTNTLHPFSIYIKESISAAESLNVSIFSLISDICLNNLNGSRFDWGWEQQQHRFPTPSF